MAVLVTQWSPLEATQLSRWEGPPGTQLARIGGLFLTSANKSPSGSESPLEGDCGD